MAKERKASVIYDGNASQLTYAFPFDYLRKAFVKVEDIYTSITELEQGTDYTVSDKEVILTKGIPIGHSVKIYRETTTEPLVEWQDASVLKSDDLSLQEVQLLHLAEETADKVFDSGMSTAYDNPNCWDGQYKRIINALDPIEDGDVVTLRYIKANQDSLLNQLKNTGATQNSSIVATGDTQNKRVTDTCNSYISQFGTIKDDIISTGNTQNTRVTTTGNAYVSTMTTLKDTATTKASEASGSAELSKKWAMSATSPDGVSGNKSSKTWAEEAKTSASNAKTSETNTKTVETTVNDYKTQAANSASAAKTSETNAKSSEVNAKTSEERAKVYTDILKKPVAYLNLLERNTAYSVGDIAYSPNLPSWAYLECTTAGTTGASEPDFSSIKSGGVILDGEAKFTIMTVGSKEKCNQVEKALNEYINSRTLKAGDIVNIGSVTVVGCITGAGMNFYLSIPLNMISASLLKGTLTGTFICRQNGNYIFDSDNTGHEHTISDCFTLDTCKFNPCGFIDVILIKKVDTYKLTNNDVVTFKFYNLQFKS